MKKSFNSAAELFNEIFKLGIKNVNSIFHKDLILDVEGLENATKNARGGYFSVYWVVRKNGTHLCTSSFEAAKVANDWAKEELFVARIEIDENSNSFTFEIIEDKR